jgi:hypothetical protein
MSDERKKLLNMLNEEFNAGRVDRKDILRQMAEYDALVATRRMPVYALLSTMVAAISAIASATAAYFAYLALQN